MLQPQNLRDTIGFLPAIEKFEGGVLIERDFDTVFDLNQGLTAGLCLQHISLVQLDSPFPLQAVFNPIGSYHHQGSNGSLGCP